MLFFIDSKAWLQCIKQKSDDGDGYLMTVKTMINVLLLAPFCILRSNYFAGRQLVKLIRPYYFGYTSNDLGQTIVLARIPMLNRVEYLIILVPHVLVSMFNGDFRNLQAIIPKFVASPSAKK